MNRIEVSEQSELSRKLKAERLSTEIKCKQHGNFEALSSSEIWGEKDPLGLDRLN